MDRAELQSFQVCEHSQQGPKVSAEYLVLPVCTPTYIQLFQCVIPRECIEIGRVMLRLRVEGMVIDFEDLEGELLKGVAAGRGEACQEVQGQGFDLVQPEGDKAGIGTQVLSNIVHVLILYRIV